MRRQHLRCAARSPGFTAAVVLTLALGVGASTAIFSVVYGVLFRPLPYRDADRLVVVRIERVLQGTQRPVRGFFPLSDLPELRSGARAFESLAFYSTEQSVLSHIGFTEKVESATVSGSFFATVGGRLQSGRGLADDDRTSVVIGERLARRLFGTETGVGRPLTIDSRPYEIVGIARRDFEFPSAKTDVWLPAIESQAHSYVTLARLNPGVSQAQAAADVNGVLTSLGAKTPRVYAGARAAVIGVRDELTGDARAALWLLLASVGLLLAVACANATTLLLARNAARSREAAIRVALGASRRQLCVQSLSEAGRLVAAGAALGLLVAAGLVDALRSLEPAGVPRLNADAVLVDWPAFLFALTVAAATTVVTGLLPAIRSGNVVESIKTGAPGMSLGLHRRRLHNGLVVVQLAVSVMLLVGASLFGRSLVRLMTTDLGVRTDRVATAAINLSYQRSLTDAQQTALLQTVVDRIRTLPDVQAAGAGASLPPGASTIVLTLKRSGDTIDYQATAVPATPGYFAALGTQILKGRLFSEADGDNSRQVMIMTAATARRFFDVDDPIGKTMTLPVLRNGVATNADVTLVGVIANVKYSGLQAAPDDAVYRPLRQQPWPRVFLVARTGGDPDGLASMLRREIAAVDPGIAVSSVSTLDAIVAGEAAEPRFRSALLMAFAAVTLGIASVGLYGVVAHTVSQRTNEFGVRMAFGAGPGDLLTLVLLEGARLAAAGLALGIGGALAATRIVAGLLYGIEPTDRVSFGLASAVLLLVAAAATYLPARRASRLSPAAALRAQ
jgi:putative ABC transport system permease protein